MEQINKMSSLEFKEKVEEQINIFIEDNEKQKLNCFHGSVNYHKYDEVISQLTKLKMKIKQINK